MEVLNNFLLSFLLVLDPFSTFIIAQDTLSEICVNKVKFSFAEPTGPLVTTVTEIVNKPKMTYYLSDINRLENFKNYPKWRTDIGALRPATPGQMEQWFLDDLMYHQTIFAQLLFRIERQREILSDLNTANLNNNSLYEAAMNTELLYIQQLELMVDYGVEDPVYSESDSDFET